MGHRPARKRCCAPGRWATSRPRWNMRQFHGDARAWGAEAHTGWLDVIRCVVRQGYGAAEAMLSPGLGQELGQVLLLAAQGRHGRLEGRKLRLQIVLERGDIGF